jgi:hypothetical protein
MRRKTMNQVIILFIGLFIGGASILPTIGGTSVETSTTNGLSTDAVTIAVQTVGETTTLHYTLDSFTKTPIVVDGKEYVRITLRDEPNSLLAGAPDLPSIHRSIVIPDGVSMNIQVTDASYTEYKNIFIIPSKGNLLRTVNPADVPYAFGDVYTKNAWYPSALAELQEPYYLRDFRGQVVTVYPFQYNPVEATLRFYTDITIEVAPSQQSGITGVTDKPVLQLDSDFLSIYKHHFINFDQVRYDPVSEQGKMLVIVYDPFYDAMVPFVEWKNLKGIPTEMVLVSEVGNAQAIKTYIADYYNNYGLTFVLLVGDAAQIPPFMEGYAASDPSLGYIVGDDHYADLFVGRFSAENLGHVETQVNRTITYERDPVPGAEWYEKGVGIGSSQGPGDDNEMDYQHIRNIRTLLLGFTYSAVDELYDGSQGGEDASGNPTPTQVAASLNEGRSIINYCGHGSQTSWGTSGFSNTNVNALTNDNMLPFIVSVACNNGEFDYGTCFGEAWLRATHNGQPVGAIGAYMSTISQSWDPPMEAQDEFNNILVGMYPENIRTTYGALCFEGAMAMIDDYGSAGIGEADYWTVFGDPSVQVRTDIPLTMNVTHEDFIEEGATTFELDVTGVSGALCAISNSGQLLGNGYADEAGHAVINFFSPVTGASEVQLMVTGFNTIPYQASISVGNPNEPPETPQKPTGESNGDAGTVYTYSTQTTDVNGDDVYYMWDWGDGNFSEWLGPFASGAEATADHSWAVKGMYPVKVKAKDGSGAESGWSDPLDVTMPVKISFGTRFIGFLEHFFPRLFSLLEHFLLV